MPGRTPDPPALTGVSVAILVGATLVWPDFDTVIANAQVSEARREVFVTTRVG